MENLEYKEVVEMLKDNPNLVELFKIVGSDPELAMIAANKLIELKANRE